MGHLQNQQLRWYSALYFVCATCTVIAYPVQQEPLPARTSTGQHEHCCEVNDSLLWTKQQNQRLVAEFGEFQSLLNYNFLLPELQLRAGLSYYGNAMRLRKFASDLMTGRRPLKVGVLGGSISAGLGAKRRHVDDWFSIFSTWVSSVAPSNVTTRNGCMPGTPSGYMELCLRHSVDPDVDLVFVEYSFNDGLVDKLLGNSVVATVERLIRRVMDLPGRPAVVLLQVPHLSAAYYEPFYATSEDLEGALSSYYNVPTISTRTALHQLAVVYPRPGWDWRHVYLDHHPGNAGHKAMADLAVHLIQTAVHDLMHVPLSDEELSYLAAPLPAPMYKGNVPPESTDCVVGEDFKRVVVSAQGWDWVNEGTDLKPKWGYVALQPGSTLLVRLNTDMAKLRPSRRRLGHHRHLHRRHRHRRRLQEQQQHHHHRRVLASSTDTPAATPTATPPTPPRILIMFQYLSTYTPMGIAQFECVSGCVCDPVRQDAWVPDIPASQIHMVGVKVSQHPRCDLRVTVLNETRSEGHKFKVAGVVVTDWDGSRSHGRYGHGEWRLPTRRSLRVPQ